MNPTMLPLAGGFRFTNNIMQLVLSDVSPEDAVKRTRQGEGASIVWIVGHLMHYRSVVMNLLGANKDSQYEKQFGNTGATDGSDYPSLADIRSQWNELHRELETVLESVTEEMLNRPAPAGGPHGEQKLLNSLVFYPWHEAYHMGALGAIRKQLGYPATADLVMGAAKAQGGEG
ncbi:MAG: DinB family protein [bacterium]|nr:DinB family protein [bacterium]